MSRDLYDNLDTLKRNQVYNFNELQLKAAISDKTISFKFLHDQYEQIKRGGVNLLIQKIFLGVSFIIFLPFIILIRLLSPIFLIRFGQLISNRIGHFAINTELYLCAREAGLIPRRIIDFFYYSYPIANVQLKKMWERTGKLNISPLARWCDKANQLLPGSTKHVIPIRRGRDIYNHLVKRPIHVQFTEEEKIFGEKEILRLGINEKSKFVCFHARDSAYLESTFPGQKWNYHDYRDSDIKNYLPAAVELVKRGHVLIRMGSKVKDKLDYISPKIVDYATNGLRSDFMDIYLGSKCHFFISSSVGIAEIPRIFRRPIMWVNFIPLEDVHTWGPCDLFIPKKIWLKDEKRFMTFKEIIESGVGRFFFGELYEKSNIESVENTAEEIFDLSVEMDERLKGTWQTTKEDEELQKRFWVLFENSDLHGKIVSRIGAKFLREHFYLLE